MAIMLPRIPVMMMTATVIATMPPNSCATPIPITVVIDLGRRVIYSLCDSPKASAKSKTQTRLDSIPDIMPVIMATAFSFKIVRFLYNGMARLTVAGVSR